MFSQIIFYVLCKPHAFGFLIHLFYKVSFDDNKSYVSQIVLF